MEVKKKRTIKDMLKRIIIASITLFIFFNCILKINTALVIVGIFLFIFAGEVLIEIGSAEALVGLSGFIFFNAMFVGVRLEFGKQGFTFFIGFAVAMIAFYIYIFSSDIE